MSSWPTTPLGELILTLETGSRPKGGVGEIPDGIPSVSGEHINREGGFYWDTPKHVSPDFYASMKRGRIQRGDILVVKDGATTGKTATVRDNFPFREAAINEHVFLLRTDTNQALPEYVGYFLFSPVGQQQILSNFRGAAIGGITQDFVRNVHVPLAPLREQDRLVKLLDGADELLKLRTQADRHTAALIPALFHERFGDPATNPNRWNDGVLGDVIHAAQDGPHVSPRYADRGVPFLSARHIKPGEVVWNDLKFLSRSDAEVQWKKCKPERGDILYTKGGTTGVASAITFDAEIAVWVHIALLKTNHEMVNSIWLESMLNSPFCYQQSQELTHGIANRDLGLTRMKKIKLFIPPLALQNEFADRVAEIRAVRTEQAASRERLESLFQSVLHGAFAGTI